MSQEEKEERVIDLSLDEKDGVFKPSGVRVVKQKKERSPKIKQTKQQKQISEIASQIEDPKVQQFLYGVNTALDIVERVKKAFR